MHMSFLPQLRYVSSTEPQTQCLWSFSLNWVATDHKPSVCGNGTARTFAIWRQVWRWSRWHGCGQKGPMRWIGFYRLVEIVGVRVRKDGKLRSRNKIVSCL
jgi:hypothetical protein